MKTEYTLGAVLFALVVAGLVYLFVSPSSTMTTEQQQTDEMTSEVVTNTETVRGNYKEIVNPSGFVNTDGITIKELVGKKVIMIDFLTYSCINCQRTFPYINAWYEKYKDQGLEIIGIHTPEFAFEKNINNVREAMKRFGITHPIVLDNDYSTWNEYGNQYWPRKYIIDIHGNVVYDHIGEGGYEETETKIRELLKERAEVLNTTVADMSGGLSSSAIIEVKNNAKSPETYFGSLRNKYLANGAIGRSGEQTLSLPAMPTNNALYLGGVWNINPEYAETVSDASVVYKYTAKEVYIVADADTLTNVEVTQDDKPVGADGGEDVDSLGVVKMKESRLYKLINNSVSGEHVLKLKLKSKGLRLYAFTFG